MVIRHGTRARGHGSRGSLHDAVGALVRAWAFVVGLASGLLADGIADWVSWLGLRGVVLLAFALLPGRRVAPSQTPDATLPRAET